jgi:D-alanyl-D-alanine dipeptidase
MQFKDIGQEVVEKIRAGVKADSGRLRAAALAAKPPIEPNPKRPFDLVDLASVDSGIKLDIRYATSNNFIGFPLYERPGAYLQRPAAEALGRVARALASRGYGLLIHDAYRPWFVTKMFWDATPESDHVLTRRKDRGITAVARWI